MSVSKNDIFDTLSNETLFVRVSFEKLRTAAAHFVVASCGSFALTENSRAHSLRCSSSPHGTGRCHGDPEERTTRTFAVREVFSPTHCEARNVARFPRVGMSPVKMDPHFICACGRKLCEAFFVDSA